MPSAGRIKAIWACAREHGIDREGVHEAIWAGWKKASVKELTDWEADRLLDGMRGKARKPAGGAGQSWERRQAMGFHGRKDDQGDPTEYLLTDEEKRVLWQTAYNLGMDDASFGRFSQRQCGTADPRTCREGNKVFWGLKAMQRRRGHVA